MESDWVGLISMSLTDHNVITKRSIFGTILLLVVVGGGGEIKSVRIQV